MEYNKLVRDKIPEIIAGSGKRVIFRGLKGDELGKALKDKLIEETQELINAETLDHIIEELADIQEVLIAIRIFHSINYHDVECMRIEKMNKNGNFGKGLYLESVEEDNDER